jgi:hypothetical protein
MKANEIKTYMDMQKWCIESQERMVDIFDRIFDNGLINDPRVASILEESSELMEELNQLQVDTEKHL